MSKPHQTADPETFNAFREQWIANNVTVEQALAVPGVAELLLEEFNNRIIDAFDEENEDEAESERQQHENEAQADEDLAEMEGDET